MLANLRRLLDIPPSPPKPVHAVMLNPGDDIEVEGCDESQDLMAEIAGATDYFILERSVFAELVLQDGAVVVQVEERPLGRLPRDVSRRYHPYLVKLAAKRVRVKCLAVLRGDWQPERGRTSFSLRVSLPEPKQMG